MIIFDFHILFQFDQLSGHTCVGFQILNYLYLKNLLNLFFRLIGIKN